MKAIRPILRTSASASISSPLLQTRHFLDQTRHPGRRRAEPSTPSSAPTPPPSSSPPSSSSPSSSRPKPSRPVASKPKGDAEGVRWEVVSKPNTQHKIRMVRDGWDEHSHGGRLLRSIRAGRVVYDVEAKRSNSTLSQDPAPTPRSTPEPSVPHDPFTPDAEGVWYSAITQQPISNEKYNVFPGDGKRVEDVLREMDAGHIMQWKPKRNRRTVIVLDSKWSGWHEVQWDGVVIKTIREKNSPHPEKPSSMKGPLLEEYSQLKAKMHEEDREKQLAELARDESSAKRMPPKDDVEFDGKRLISLVNSSENVVTRAYTVFKFMERKNLIGSALTFGSLLTACLNTCQFELGLNVWRMMLARGALPDLRAYNTLLSLANKSGNKAYCFVVFEELREFGLLPDRATFMHLLNANKTEAHKIINEMRAQGVQTIPDSILLRIFCESEDLEKATALWKQMIGAAKRPTVEEYNLMLLLYERRNEYSRAVELFNVMEARSVAPNFLTYNTVMNMMAINGDIEKLHKVQTMMHDRKVTTLVVLSTFQFSGKDTSIVNGVNMNLSVSIDVPTFDGEQDVALSTITQQLVQHLEYNSDYKPNFKGLPTYTLLHLGNEYSQRASLQFHCEKKSLAYLLLKHGRTAEGQPTKHLPRINVNARMCMDCHDLFAAASKTFRVKVECNDNHTLHVFDSGEDLSCLSGWRESDAINVPGSGQYGKGL